MAKKEAKPETVIERSYNIPLRKEWLKVPKWKRTKKATKAAREFLQKHMKSDNVKLGKFLNEAIWKHGGKNPPHHIKVDVTKDSEGVVKAELAGAPEEKEVKKPVKKEEKKEEAKKVVEEKEQKTKKIEKSTEKEVKKPEEKPQKEEKPISETEEVEKIAKDIMQKGSAK